MYGTGGDSVEIRISAKDETAAGVNAAKSKINSIKSLTTTPITIKATDATGTAVSSAKSKLATIKSTPINITAKDTTGTAVSSAKAKLAGIKVPDIFIKAIDTTGTAVSSAKAKLASVAATIKPAVITAIDATTAAITTAKTKLVSVAAAAKPIILTAVDMTGAAFASVHAKIHATSLKVAALISQLTLVAGMGAVAGAGYSLKAFLDFEDAMADVRKTTGLTKEEILALGNALTELSQTELPMDRIDLAKIAAVAGQLGIATEDILDFTRSAAKMGIAFDMTGQKAAESMGSMAIITKTPIPHIEKLGSAINEVANNSAAAEAPIIDFIASLGPAGEQLGFTAAEVIALGATLVELKVDASDAGTRIARAFQMIKENMPAFAEFLDPEAAQLDRFGDELRTQFETDPMKAFMAILQKLTEEEGNWGTTTSELFETIGSRAITGLVGNFEGLERNLKNANKAFEEGISLEEEFARKTETQSASLTLAKNKAVAGLSEIGEELAPVAVDAANAFTAAIPGLLEWASTLKTELQPAIHDVKQIFADLKKIVKDVFTDDTFIKTFATAVNYAANGIKAITGYLAANPDVSKLVAAIGLVSIALLAFDAHPGIIALAALVVTLGVLEEKWGTLSKLSEIISPTKEEEVKDIGRKEYLRAGGLLAPSPTGKSKLPGLLSYPEWIEELTKKRKQEKQKEIEEKTVTYPGTFKPEIIPIVNDENWLEFEDNINTTTLEPSIEIDQSEVTTAYDGFKAKVTEAIDIAKAKYDELKAKALDHIPSVTTLMSAYDSFKAKVIEMIDNAKAKYDEFKAKALDHIPSVTTLMSVYDSFKAKVIEMIDIAKAKYDEFKAKALDHLPSVTTLMSAYDSFKAKVIEMIDIAKAKYDEFKAKALDHLPSVTTLMSVYDSFKAKVIEMIDIAKAKYDELKSKVEILQGAVELAKTAWASALSVIHGLLEIGKRLVGELQAAWENLKSWIETNPIVTTVINGPLQTALNLVSSLVSAWDSLKSHIEKNPISGFINIIQKIFTGGSSTSSTVPKGSLQTAPTKKSGQLAQKGGEIIKTGEVLIHKGEWVMPIEAVEEIRELIDTESRPTKIVFEDEQHSLTSLDKTVFDETDKLASLYELMRSGEVFANINKSVFDDTNELLGLYDAMLTKQEQQSVYQNKFNDTLNFTLNKYRDLSQYLAGSYGGTYGYGMTSEAYYSKYVGYGTPPSDYYKSKWGTAKNETTQKTQKELITNQEHLNETITKTEKVTNDVEGVVTTAGRQMCAAVETVANETMATAAASLNALNTMWYAFAETMNKAATASMNAMNNVGNYAGVGGGPGCLARASSMFPLFSLDRPYTWDDLSWYTPGQFKNVYHAQKGGEVIKEGLVQIHKGEWIMPQMVTDTLKDIVGSPQQSSGSKSIQNNTAYNITMNNTITNKSDADYLINKIERMRTRKVYV